jgi:hypothetical protein
MKKALLVFFALSMLLMQACKKDNDQSPKQELVKNKMIIGEWTLQSYSFNVYDATTGAQKSADDYDIPKISKLTFTSDGRYRTNLGSSGRYEINEAGTTLTFNDGSKMSITKLEESQLNLTATEVSENSRLVLMQYFTK